MARDRNSSQNVRDYISFRDVRIEKGGQNPAQSPITQRPAPPEPIDTIQSVQPRPSASDQKPSTGDSSQD